MKYTIDDFNLTATKVECKDLERGKFYCDISNPVNAVVLKFVKETDGVVYFKYVCGRKIYEETDGIIGFSAIGLFKQATLKAKP